jgi:hypothetical protein
MLSGLVRRLSGQRAQTAVAPAAPAVEKAPCGSKRARTPIDATALGPSPCADSEGEEGEDPGILGDDDGSSDGGSSDDNEEELDALSNEPDDSGEEESEGEHTSELHVRVHTPGNSDVSSPGDAPPQRRPFHDQMAAPTRFEFDDEGGRVGPMYAQEGDANDEVGSPVPIAAEGLPTHFVSIDVVTTGKNLADDKIIRLAVNVCNEHREVLLDSAWNFSNGNIQIRPGGCGAGYGLSAADLVGLRDFDDSVGYILDTIDGFLDNDGCDSAALVTWDALAAKFLYAAAVRATCDWPETLTHQILIARKLALASDIKKYATQSAEGEWPRKGGKPVMASLTHVIERLGATRDCFEQTRSTAGANPSFVDLIGLPDSDPLGVARAANEILLDSDFWGGGCFRRQQSMVGVLDPAALPGGAARARGIGGCADGTGHQVHLPWTAVELVDHPPPDATGASSSQAPPQATRAATRAKHQRAISENAPPFSPPAPPGASEAMLSHLWQRGLRCCRVPAAVARAALQGVAAVLPAICADTLVGDELLLAIFLFYLTGPILTRIAEATNAHALEPVISVSCLYRITT